MFVRIMNDTTSGGFLIETFESRLGKLNYSTKVTNTKKNAVEEDIKADNYTKAYNNHSRMLNSYLKKIANI